MTLSTLLNTSTEATKWNSATIFHYSETCQHRFCLIQYQQQYKTISNTCTSLTSRSLLVKSHHTSSDGHVHGNLRGHAANQDHLLASVGMESRVKNIFGLPQFIFCQSWGDYSLPWRHLTVTFYTRLVRSTWWRPLMVIYCCYLPVVTDDFVCMS